MVYIPTIDGYGVQWSLYMGSKPATSICFKKRSSLKKGVL